MTVDFLRSRMLICYKLLSCPRTYKHILSAVHVDAESVASEKMRRLERITAELGANLMQFVKKCEHCGKETLELYTDVVSIYIYILIN